MHGIVLCFLGKARGAIVLEENIGNYQKGN
jgi:hypothetical protein